MHGTDGGFPQSSNCGLEVSLTAFISLVHNCFRVKCISSSLLSADLMLPDATDVLGMITVFTFDCSARAHYNIGIILAQ